MPDEIIVKFRTSVTDADIAVGVAPNRKSIAVQDLQIGGKGFRVREAKPLLRQFENSDLPRLTANREHVLRWRQRAPATGHRRNLGNIYRVRVDLEAGATLDKVLAVYRSRPDVEYAELNPIISICATPNDPSYADQWALAKIHAAEAWDICRGSDGVIVAVIDTGVDYNHPDLQANMWTNEAEGKGLVGVDDDGNGYVDDVHGFNFAYGNNNPIDDHGHGTAVTGIIAAVGNNGANIAGICWTARIMPVKILSATGDGTAADAVPAIYYAVANGADIVSGSWGGADTSDALRDAIAYAHDQGVVIVAAAGNSGSAIPFYPAAYPDVISVAATESTDDRWYLSNYGDWVDIAAPGRDILSLRALLPGQTARAGSNVRMSGTSLAAPHVSGACALLLAANPFLRCEELQQILTATADPIQPGTCASNGRLNVDRALRAVIPPEGTIRMDRAYYAESTEIGLLLADWHLKGAGHAAVIVETAGGDQETVTLTETDIALGVLRGTIASRNAPVKPGDGILQIHDGEGIQVRYLNGDDGSGRTGQWRSASAIADYTRPIVSNLDIKPQSGVTTIEFRTSEPTRAELRYGQTRGGPYDWIQRDAGVSERHSIDLHGLTPPAQFYFVVALTDEAGNEAVADNNGQSYSFVAQR